MSLNQAKRVEKEKNIQVVVRCRPYNAFERKAACHGVIDCDQNRREVSVKTGGVNDKARKAYTFDMVFGPAAKQIEVYRSVVYPILNEVIMGYNCTVFAYGQTGTGKTFTMEGERTPNEEFTWEDDPLAGIIPRTLHQIFEKLTSNGTEFSVKVSLLEIYNEELFDLLSTNTDGAERLQLFDDPRNKRGVTIKGLEEITVHNKDEVYLILERGAAKRKTASTLMNAYSSRSHSVFSITIHMKEITLEGEELVKIGKLNLVDLAGSESIGRSGAVDKRAREAGSINQSLLTLGRVITALVEKRPHIPYRESKLTRILQDSLGGHTKTSIIATVSPASINMEESLSTLEYANRAKSILNKPEVNQKLTKRTLIKEYTEEIERLKRDLAATRDKNGVYLSTANYEGMNEQITAHEEQITEYTERIAAMEEELKKVTELFEDHKSQLDRCSSELEEKSQYLQETLGDLQQTQVKLTQEEFISTELATTHEQLYSTAGKLLRTAESSTSDVSGLHAKLDRKKQVEEHNSEIQTSFSQCMESMFFQMQHSLQEQGSRHQGMLDHYTASVESLQATNDETFKGAVATVASCLGGVRELVADGVAKVQAKMAEQEGACLHTRDSLQQVLEEHQEEMEEVLLAQVLPGLSAVKELNETLKSSSESHRALATQMETMKEQMSVFFSSHAEDLAALREITAQGLESLQAEHHRLKEQISQAAKKHQTGISQAIQCLSDQLNLLALDTQSDCAGLISSADALQGPVLSMQNTLTSRCSDAERQLVAQRDQLSSTATSVVSELQQAAQDVQETAEESSGYCSHLHSSLGGLAEKSLQWCSSTREQAQNQAQDQLTLLRENIASTHILLEGVEHGCDTHLQGARGQLEQQQEEVAQGQGAMREQISLDRSTLEDHQREMQTLVDSGLARVHTFLGEELRQDATTGTTPQRKEYMYPRVLARARNRAELLESLHHQQGELQAALNQGDTVAEEEEVEEEQQQQLEQDSLEDALNDDSTLSQQSYVDENLVCNERGPFFKKKKARRNVAKTVHRPKMAENETPPRSRLPLRSQNI